MLGYCIGATLAVAYAGLYPDAPIRNLVLLTAPLDFGGDNAGSMAVWLDEKNLDLDKLINAYGNVPGELIRTNTWLPCPMIEGASSIAFDRPAAFWPIGVASSQSMTTPSAPDRVNLGIMSSRTAGANSNERRRPTGLGSITARRYLRPRL